MNERIVTHSLEIPKKRFLSINVVDRIIYINGIDKISFDPKDDLDNHAWKILSILSKAPFKTVSFPNMSPNSQNETISPIVEHLQSYFPVEENQAPWIQVQAISEQGVTSYTLNSRVVVVKS